MRISDCSSDVCSSDLVLAPDCDLVLVVGSPNSSNSNRLREVAERIGTDAHLVDGADAIDPAWLAGRQRLGLTAGASAPERPDERRVGKGWVNTGRLRWWPEP